MRRMVRPLELVAVVAVVAAVLAVPSAGDVIFQVPEVLVRHAAVPKPVGTGRPGGGAGAGGSRSPNDSGPWPESDLVQQRFEYFVEHSVSTGDAKKMATMLKLSQIPQSSPGCGECTKRELEYCETKVVADHCCCERQFLPEPFPWLPHTCYIGPERCEPMARNCAQYARLRDCCCMYKLAEHWKGILSNSTSIGVSGVTLIVLVAASVTVYL